MNRMIMKNRQMFAAAIGILLLVQALAGCSDPDLSAPRWAPSPVGPPVEPPAIRLLDFTDPLTGLKTSDVVDVHDQIVRFNSADDLIWAADDTHFPRFPVNYGYERGAFAVIFAGGTGQRRAYLTFNPDYYHYPPPPSRVDLEVVEGRLVIRHPDPPVFVPGT